MTYREQVMAEGQNTVRSDSIARLLRGLSILSIVTLPFTSAFALHAWAPLNLVVMAVTALAMATLAPRQLRWKADPEDWLLVTAIFLGYVGLLFAPEYGPKTANHCLAIFTCAILYYLFAKCNIYPYLRWQQVVNAAALMTVGSGLFVISEFILANFADVKLSQYIPYVEMQQAGSETSEAMMMGYWIRPRGFAIEAGHMATAFELGLPLTLLASKRMKHALRTLTLLISLAGFLLLASAAATIAMIISSAFVVVRRRAASQARWLILTILLVGCLAVALSEGLRLYASDLVFTKTLEFVGLAEQEQISAMDRSQRVGAAIDIAHDFPFGLGWGTAAQLSSQGSQLVREIPFGFISLPAEFLVAGGWLSLLSLVVFFLCRILRVGAIKTPDAEMLLLGLCSLSIHYLTMSNYWFPVLWASLGLSTVYQEQHGNSEPHARSGPALLA